MNGLQEREAQARARLSVAAATEAAHYQDLPGWCICDRRWPCSVVIASQEARDLASRELKAVREFPTAETILLPACVDEDQGDEQPAPPRPDHRAPRQLARKQLLNKLRRSAR